jgi:hypothetical protein
MASPDPSLPKPILPRPAPLLGPTATSSLLVGATCVIALLDAWTAWYRHGVAFDYVAGVPGMWVADLTSADSTGRTVDVLYVLVMAAAAIALLVWLSRVRANARLLGHAVHPLRRTVALSGWFAVTLFSVGTTVLFGADASVAELRVLATVDSVGAVVQCVAGGVLIVVIRQVTRCRPRTGAGHPRRAVRG